MSYAIQFTDDGLADVKALPKSVRNSLAKALKSKVAKDPIRCSEPLRGPLAGWHSFHFGKYRVIFRIYEDLKVVAIAGIGSHSSQAGRDICRKLEALARRGELAKSILATLRGFSDPRDE